MVSLPQNDMSTSIANSAGSWLQGKQPPRDSVLPQAELEKLATEETTGGSATISTGSNASENEKVSSCL